MDEDELVQEPQGLEAPEPGAVLASAQQGTPVGISDMMGGVPSSRPWGQLPPGYINQLRRQYYIDMAELVRPTVDDATQTVTLQPSAAWQGMALTIPHPDSDVITYLRNSAHINGIPEDRSEGLAYTLYQMGQNHPELDLGMEAVTNFDRLMLLDDGDYWMQQMAGAPDDNLMALYMDAVDEAYEEWGRVFRERTQRDLMMDIMGGWRTGYVSPAEEYRRELARGGTSRVPGIQPAQSAEPLPPPAAWYFPDDGTPHPPLPIEDWGGTNEEFVRLFASKYPAYGEITSEYASGFPPDLRASTAFWKEQGQKPPGGFVAQQELLPVRAQLIPQLEELGKLQNRPSRWWVDTDGLLTFTSYVGSLPYPPRDDLPVEAGLADEQFEETQGRPRNEQEVLERAVWEAQAATDPYTWTIRLAPGTEISTNKDAMWNMLLAVSGMEHKILQDPGEVPGLQTWFGTMFERVGVRLDAMRLTDMDRVWNFISTNVGRALEIGATHALNLVETPANLISGNQFRPVVYSEGWVSWDRSMSTSRMWEQNDRNIAINAAAAMPETDPWAVGISLFYDAMSYRPRTEEQENWLDESGLSEAGPKAQASAFSGAGIMAFGATPEEDQQRQLAEIDTLSRDYAEEQIYARTRQAAGLGWGRLLNERVWQPAFDTLDAYSAMSSRLVNLVAAIPVGLVEGVDEIFNDNEPDRTIIEAFTHQIGAALFDERGRYVSQMFGIEGTLGAVLDFVGSIAGDPLTWFMPGSKGVASWARAMLSGSKEARAMLRNPLFFRMIRRTLDQADPAMMCLWGRGLLPEELVLITDSIDRLAANQGARHGFMRQMTSTAPHYGAELPRVMDVLERALARGWQPQITGRVSSLVNALGFTELMRNIHRVPEDGVNRIIDSFVPAMAAHKFELDPRWFMDEWVEAGVQLMAGWGRRADLSAWYHRGADAWRRSAHQSGTGVIEALTTEVETAGRELRKMAAERGARSKLATTLRINRDRIAAVEYAAEQMRLTRITGAADQIEAMALRYETGASDAAQAAVRPLDILDQQVDVAVEEIPPSAVTGAPDVEEAYDAQEWHPSHEVPAAVEVEPPPIPIDEAAMRPPEMPVELEDALSRRIADVGQIHVQAEVTLDEAFPKAITEGAWSPEISAVSDEAGRARLDGSAGQLVVEDQLVEMSSIAEQALRSQIVHGEQTRAVSMAVAAADETIASDWAAVASTELASTVGTRPRNIITDVSPARLIRDPDAAIAYQDIYDRQVTNWALQQINNNTPLARRVSGQVQKASLEEIINRLATDAVWRQVQRRALKGAEPVRAGADRPPRTWGTGSLAAEGTRVRDVDGLLVVQAYARTLGPEHDLTGEIFQIAALRHLYTAGLDLPVIVQALNLASTAGLDTALRNIYKTFDVGFGARLVDEVRATGMAAEDMPFKEGTTQVGGKAGGGLEFMRSYAHGFTPSANIEARAAEGLRRSLGGGLNPQEVLGRFQRRAQEIINQIDITPAPVDALLTDSRVRTSQMVDMGREPATLEDALKITWDTEGAVSTLARLPADVASNEDALDELMREWLLATLPSDVSLQVGGTDMGVLMAKIDDLRYRLGYRDWDPDVESIFAAVTPPHMSGASLMDHLSPHEQLGMKKLRGELSAKDISDIEARMIAEEAAGYSAAQLDIDSRPAGLRRMEMEDPEDYEALQLYGETTPTAADEELAAEAGEVVEAGGAAPPMGPADTGAAMTPEEARAMEAAAVQQEAAEARLAPVAGVDDIEEFALSGTLGAALPDDLKNILRRRKPESVAFSYLIGDGSAANSPTVKELWDLSSWPLIRPTDVKQAAAWDAMIAEQHRRVAIAAYDRLAQDTLANPFRPGGWSPYTNKVIETWDEALDIWKRWVGRHPEILDRIHQTRGSILVCTDHPGPCHGEIIRDLRNGATPQSLGIRLPPTAADGLANRALGLRPAPTAAVPTQRAIKGLWNRPRIAATSLRVERLTPLHGSTSAASGAVSDYAQAFGYNVKPLEQRPFTGIPRIDTAQQQAQVANSGAVLFFTSAAADPAAIDRIRQIAFGGTRRVSLDNAGLKHTVTGNVDEIMDQQVSPHLRIIRGSNGKTVYVASGLLDGKDLQEIRQGLFLENITSLAVDATEDLTPEQIRLYLHQVFEGARSGDGALMEVTVNRELADEISKRLTPGPTIETGPPQTPPEPGELLTIGKTPPVAKDMPVPSDLLPPPGARLSRIRAISGVQAGADMGWVRGAKRAGVRTGGTAPPGGRSEVGALSQKEMEALGVQPISEAHTRRIIKTYNLEPDPKNHPLSEAQRIHIPRSILNAERGDVTIPIYPPVPQRRGARGLYSPESGTPKTIGLCLTGQWRDYPRGMLHRIAPYVYVSQDGVGFRPVLAIMAPINYPKIDQAVEAAARWLAARPKLVTWNGIGPRASLVKGLEDWAATVSEKLHNAYNRIAVTADVGLMPEAEKALKVAAAAGEEIADVGVAMPPVTFAGREDYLSNFFASPVTVRGKTFANAESAFQALKSGDEEVWQAFSQVSDPGQARSMGRQIPGLNQQEWESRRLDVMEEVLRAKFAQNPELAERLMATGDAELVHITDRWGDIFWGRANGEGENQMGKILIKIREDLRAQRGASAVLDTQLPPPGTVPSFAKLDEAFAHMRRNNVAVVANISGQRKEFLDLVASGDAVYVGRKMPATRVAGGLPESPIANPYPMTDYLPRERVLWLYGVELLSDPEKIRAAQALRGKIVGCWCGPEACHADLVVRLANGEDPRFLAEMVGPEGVQMAQRLRRERQLMAQDYEQAVRYQKEHPVRTVGPTRDVPDVAVGMTPPAGIRVEAEAAPAAARPARPAKPTAKPTAKPKVKPTVKLADDVSIELKAAQQKFMKAKTPEAKKAAFQEVRRIERDVHVAAHPQPPRPTPEPSIALPVGDLTEAHTTSLVEIADAMKSKDAPRIRRAIAAYKKIDEQLRNAPDLHAAEVRRQQLAARPANVGRTRPVEGAPPGTVFKETPVYVDDTVPIPVDQVPEPLGLPQVEEPFDAQAEAAERARESGGWQEEFIGTPEQLAAEGTDNMTWDATSESWKPRGEQPAPSVAELAETLQPDPAAAAAILAPQNPPPRALYTPEHITELAEDEIFVFGSNELGIHGRGAALTAKLKFGAEPGVGRGLTGQTYALPTKATPAKALSSDEIRANWRQFCEFADQNPNRRFLVTPFGTGLAGYTDDQILRALKGIPIPDNVVLPKGWAGPLDPTKYPTVLGHALLPPNVPERATNLADEVFAPPVTPLQEKVKATAIAVSKSGRHEGYNGAKAVREIIDQGARRETDAATGLRRDLDRIRGELTGIIRSSDQMTEQQAAVALQRIDILRMQQENVEGMIDMYVLRATTKDPEITIGGRTIPMPRQAPVIRNYRELQKLVPVDSVEELDQLIRVTREKRVHASKLLEAAEQDVSAARKTQKGMEATRFSNMQRIARIRRGEFDRQGLLDVWIEELDKIGKQMGLPELPDVGEGGGFVRNRWHSDKNRPQLDWSGVRLGHHSEAMHLDHPVSDAWSEVFTGRERGNGAYEKGKKVWDDHDLLLEMQKAPMPASIFEILAYRAGATKFMNNATKKRAAQLTVKAAREVGSTVNSVFAMNLLWNAITPLKNFLDQSLRQYIATGSLGQALDAFWGAVPALGRQGGRLRKVQESLIPQLSVPDNINPSLRPEIEEWMREGRGASNPTSMYGTEFVVRENPAVGRSRVPAWFRTSAHRWLTQLQQIDQFRLWAETRRALRASGIESLPAPGNIRLYRAHYLDDAGAAVYVAPRWVTDHSEIASHQWYTTRFEDMVELGDQAKGKRLVITAEDVDEAGMEAADSMAPARHHLAEGTPPPPWLNHHYIRGKNSEWATIKHSTLDIATYHDAFRNWYDWWNYKGGHHGRKTRVWALRRPSGGTPGNPLPYEALQVTGGVQETFTSMDGLVAYWADQITVDPVVNRPRFVELLAEALANPGKAPREELFKLMPSTPMEAPIQGGGSRVGSFANNRFQDVWDWMYGNPQTRQGGNMFAQYLAENLEVLNRRLGDKVLDSGGGLSKLQEVLGLGTEAEAKRAYRYMTEDMRSQIRSSGYVVEGDLREAAVRRAQQQVRDLLYQTVAASIGGRAAAKYYSPFIRAHADYLRFWLKSLFAPSYVGFSPAMRRVLSAAKVVSHPSRTLDAMAAVGTSAGKARKLWHMTGPGTFTSGSVRDMARGRRSGLFGGKAATPEYLAEQRVLDKTAVMPLNEQSIRPLGVYGKRWEGAQAGMDRAFIPLPLNLRLWSRYAHIVSAAAEDESDTNPASWGDARWFGTNGRPRDSREQKARDLFLAHASNPIMRMAKALTFIPFGPGPQLHTQLFPSPGWLPVNILQFTTQMLPEKWEELSRSALADIFPYPFSWLGDTDYDGAQFAETFLSSGGRSMLGTFNKAMRILPWTKEWFAGQDVMNDPENTLIRYLAEQGWSNVDAPPGFWGEWRLATGLTVIDQMEQNPSMLFGPQQLSGWAGEQAPRVLGYQNYGYGTASLERQYAISPKDAPFTRAQPELLMLGPVVEAIVSTPGVIPAELIPNFALLWKVVTTGELPSVAEMQQLWADYLRDKDIDLNTADSPGLWGDLITDNPRLESTEANWLYQTIIDGWTNLPIEQRRLIMREPGGLGIALALTPHWVGATTVGSGELRAPAEWLPYFKADNTVNWDKLIEERGAEGMNQFIDEGADGSWLDSIQAVTVDQENGWLERAYRMWLGNQTSSINDIWKGATGFEVSQSDAVTARSLLFQRVRLDGNAHVIDRDYSWPDLGGSADNQQIMFNDYTGTGQEDVYIWAEISANDGRPVVAITGEDLRWLESILGTSLPAQMTGQELRNTLQTRKNAVNSRAQYDATIDLVTMKLNSVPSVTPNPDNISNGVRVFSGPEVATQVDHLLHGWTEEVARGDDIRHPSLATYYGVDSFADVPEAGKKRVRDWYEYAIAQGYMTYDDYEDAGLNVKLGPIASKLDIPTSVDQFDTSFQVDPGQIVAVSGDTVFLNTDATQRFFGVPANGGEMSAQMQQLQRQAAYPGAGIDNTGMPDRLRLANIQFTQQMYGDFGSTGIYVRVQGLNAPWAGMQGSAEARAALQKFFDDLDAAGGTITFGQYRPEYWGSWVNYDPARGVQHAKMWMAPQGVVLTDESVFTVKSPLGYGYPRPGYIPDYLQLWLNSGGEMPVLDYSEVE